MESYLAKMKEYLSMDTELPFPEYAEYYKEFMDYLNTNFEGFDQDTSIKARFVVSILTVNSEDRARRKGSEAKKYKKMAEKSKFWMDAITYRLKKDGMTEEQIEHANAAISDAM